MALETAILERIRKSAYGQQSSKALDFNSIFSGVNNNSLLSISAAGNNMAAIANKKEQPGGDPANNASAESTATSSAVGNAIGVAVANAVVGMIGLPGLSTAINALTNNAISISNAVSNVSDVNAAEAFEAALDNPDVDAATSAANASGDDGSGDSSSGGGAGNSGNGGDAAGGDAGSGTGADAGY